jgi:hypothetical protein
MRGEKQKKPCLPRSTHSIQSSGASNVLYATDQDGTVLCSARCLLGVDDSINDDFLEVFCSHAALSARTRDICGITMVHHSCLTALQPCSLAPPRPGSSSLTALKSTVAPGLSGSSVCFLPPMLPHVLPLVCWSYPSYSVNKDLCLETHQQSSPPTQCHVEFLVGGEARLVNSCSSCLSFPSHLLLGSVTLHRQ